jgi:hypothetical protein
MATAMASASVASYKAQRSAGGVSITYARGVNSVALSVVVGSSPSLVANDYGVVVDERHYRDFLILASELILAASTELPARGDIITEGTKTYLVTADGGEPHYVYSDRFEQITRVHTVEKVTP